MFNKAFSYGFILSIAITNLAIAMEHPQLQLQNPGKQNKITSVNCSIMISDQMQSPIVYTTKKLHNAQYNNLSSNINDPLVFLDITEPSTGCQSVTPIATKHLYNLTTGSRLQFQENEPALFDGKPLLISAICQTNPNLDGENFFEQLANVTHKFYKNPSFLIPNGDSIKELKTAGITTKQTMHIPIRITNQRSHETVSDTIGTTLFTHGPKGCPNEQALIQSIIDEKIPTNKNRVLSLRDREIKSSFKKH